MKAYKILLFILSVIALLGLLCSFFPREGVQIGGISLEFPSLEDILIEEEEISESPDQIIENRQKAIRGAQKNDFLMYFYEDPARIHMPGGDLEYLDGFFEALENADFKHMRIVHYGDSQIEEDRISKVLRDSLQTKFGGGGPGLLPVREKYNSLSISESSTSDPDRYLVFGDASMRGGNNRYGIMGQRFHYDTTVTTTISALKSNTGPGRYFNQVTLLSSGGDLYVSCKGQTQRFESTQEVRHVRFTLPDSTTRVSITHSGSHDIYGIMVDCSTGVSLDNIPMRGCAGTIFSSISSAQLKDYFNEENVRFIILQYGGNVVPYTKTGKSISQYKQSIGKQIRLIKSLAPDACILFIGPSDMSTNISGKMQTYPHLPALVDSLRDVTLESGAAFWDMYSAMGGQGAMKNWVQHQPPLAGSDYVHFTPKGAEKIGGMLYESMMLYYDYYRFRKNEL